MRSPLVLLALAALGAAGAAGWFLLRPMEGPAAPGPGSTPTAPPSPWTSDPLEGLSGEAPAPPPPAPAPGGTRRTAPRRDAAGNLLRPDGTIRPERLRGPDAWKDEVDGVPPRDPKPLAKGVEPGEYIPEGLSEDEERGVATLREKMLTTPLKTVRYHGRSLESVAAEISSAAGIAVELSGEDLADEPVAGEFPDSDAFDRLMRIAVDRNLRIEVRPDRIVIRR